MQKEYAIPKTATGKGLVDTARGAFV